MNSKQEANRRYYEKNKERLKQEAKDYYWKNRERRLETQKIWHSQNKERRSELFKRWKTENRVRYREINKTSLAIQLERNPALKARRAWRGRIWRVFIKGSKSPRTISVLGCSPEQFREHIYSQLHGEMRYENYAVVWELDHIEPCYKFDCTNEEQLRACFHYTNYRPRLKTENQWNPNQKHETKTKQRLAGRA